MQPGSFIDLLMRAKDKTTGRGFTDMEIANQVIYTANPCFTTLSDACASMLLWPAPQRCVLEALNFFQGRIYSRHCRGLFESCHLTPLSDARLRSPSATVQML